MKTKAEIIEWIAYIQHGSAYFQELVYDAEGTPIDWDEAATAAAYQVYMSVFTS